MNWLQICATTVHRLKNESPEIAFGVALAFPNTARVSSKLIAFMLLEAATVILAINYISTITNITDECFYIRLLPIWGIDEWTSQILLSVKCHDRQNTQIILQKHKLQKKTCLKVISIYSCRMTKLNVHVVFKSETCYFIHFCLLFNQTFTNFFLYWK